MQSSSPVQGTERPVCHRTGRPLLVYGFSAVVERDLHHQALSSKDRTGLFQNGIFVITEETGEQIKDWLTYKPATQELPTQALSVPVDEEFHLEPIIGSGPFDH